MKKLLSIIAVLAAASFMSSPAASAQNKITITPRAVADGNIAPGCPQTTADFDVVTTFTALTYYLQVKVSDPADLVSEIIVWSGNKIVGRKAPERDAYMSDTYGYYYDFVNLSSEATLRGKKIPYRIEFVTKDNGSVWNNPRAVVSVVPVGFYYDLPVNIMEGSWETGATYRAVNPTYVGTGFSMETIGEAPDVAAASGKEIPACSATLKTYDGRAALATYMSFKMITSLPVEAKGALVVRLVVNGVIVTKKAGAKKVFVTGKMVPTENGNGTIRFEGLEVAIPDRGATVKLLVIPGVGLKGQSFTVAPTPDEWVLRSVAYPTARIQHPNSYAYAGTTITVKK